MAYTQNEKSTGLDALTTLASNDLIIVGDVSDAGRAKAITKANLIADVTGGNTVIQSGLQFEDEGVNLGTPGTVDELDFVGGNVTAARAGNKVTVTVSAGSSTNASTTVAGVVQEATQSEVNAGTATGTTGARLFVNPSSLAGAILAYITASLTTYTALLLKNVINADETVNDWFTITILAPFTGTQSTESPWTNGGNCVQYPNGSDSDGNGGFLAVTTRGVISIDTDDVIKFDSAKDWKIKFRLTNEPGVGVTPLGAGVIWAFVGFVASGSSADNADITHVGQRYGFSYYNGKIYTIVADGAAVSAFDAGAYTVRAPRGLQMNYNNGVSVDFYINGALVRTEPLLTQTNADMKLTHNGSNGSGGGSGGPVTHFTFSQKI